MILRMLFIYQAKKILVGKNKSIIILHILSNMMENAIWSFAGRYKMSTKTGFMFMKFLLKTK